MSRIVKTTLFAMIAMCVALTAAAHGPNEQERNNLEVNAYLTAIFPTYPDYPSFTANAFHANLVYWIEERGKAALRGEDFPRLTYSTDDGPGELQGLTVVVEGIPGTTSILDWTAYPKVTLSPVELRIKAYDKVASQLSREDQPLIDIILSDLTLSTEETCAEGYCTAGYLDAENLEAQLVFSTELPQSDWEPYNRWLADHPMLGELRVQLPNPFKK